MDAEEQQRMRALLRELRAAASARVETLAASINALTHDRASMNDDDEHDPEGVPLSAEWSRLTGLADAARAELAQIDGALARVDTGDYGTCARCGRPIPLERLEVRPFAEYCVPCSDRLRR